jgi:DNA-binding winged helix-turn-helix (wHTH) protein
MAGLAKIVDVHSHSILPYGPGAPVRPGQQQPKWSVESAISYMDEHDISACVLSDPDSANHATGQEARDIARRVNETLADIVSRRPSRFGAVAALPGRDADGCGVARREFSRRSKSMTSNIRRETGSLGKQPLSIVIIIPRMEPCVRSPVEPRETVLQVGSLELDLIDRTARRGNRPIDLRPREFQLLKYMMQRSDQVLTHADLLRDVWHYKFVPETNRINVHMGRLRSKIDGPNEAPMIRNLRGEGFVLSATPALAKNLPGLRGLGQRELTQTNSNNV